MTIEAYRKGSTLVVKGTTYDFNPKVTREDMAEHYERNPLLAARDYDCIPPKSVQSGLPDPDVVERLANKTRPSPIRADGSFEEWFKGDPATEYFLHIDMSKSHDPTGMGMCHYSVLEDKFVMDLIHNLDPSATWELSFERNFILIMQLRELGFTLKKVTFDSWQSFYMLEKLINAGIPAEIYSVDKTTEAYDTLISTLLMRKLDYYFQARFVEELKYIKLIGGTRYDHEHGRTKDVCDGVAGSVTQCVKAHTGLALTDAEVKKSTHEEHFLELQENSLAEGTTVWSVASTVPVAVERSRRRVMRIDAVDDDIITVLGWHDKANDRLYVDEFLVWENFTNDQCITALESFINDLGKFTTIATVSVNDKVPAEILSFLKTSGRQVSSPMAARGNRRQRGVSTSRGVSDTTLRQMVSQIKKGNLSLPDVPNLVRDLKFMTSTNQTSRPYACALAGWLDYAIRETIFGNTGATMARPLSSGPTALNSQSQQGARGSANQTMLPRGMRSGSGANADIDSIRAKYAVQSFTHQTQKVQQPGTGIRALPRPITGGR